MRNKKTRFLSQAALLCALYVVLTFVSAMFGLSGGAIQLRLSEALTVLPAFTPAAIPGLAIGCLLANLLTGCALWDIVFGTLATLIAALGTRALKKYPYLAPLPPIIANTLVIPFILQYVYGAEGSLYYFCLTVGAGELLSCGVLGTLFTLGIQKTNLKTLF